MGRKFGWHSGTLTCQDAKVRGDLYVQDDIIFSDVSAGRLGVTGGIDMSGTTSAIGIDLGGTYSTVAINIDGTMLGTTSSAIQVTLDYDMGSSGVGENYPSAIRLDLTQTGVGASEEGGFYGIHARLHAAYGNLGTYGLFSRCYITATGSAQQINDVIAVMGELRIDGVDTKKYATTSQLAALRGSVSNSSTGTFDAQVYALSLDFGANANFGGTSALIFGWTHADVNCDYGMYIDNYSPNMASGILLFNETSGDMAKGIELDSTGSGAFIIGIDIGKCTTGIDFTGANTTCLKVSTTASFFADFDDATTCAVDITGSAASTIKGQILVKTVAGDTGYINIYGTTGS